MRYSGAQPLQFSPLDFSDADRRLGVVIASMLAAAALVGVALTGAAIETLFLFGVSLSLVILFEPRLGLYCAVIAVGVDRASIDPVMSLAPPMFQPIRGSIATPVEAMILVTAVSWLLEARRTREFYLPPRPLLIGVGIMFLSLVIALEYGASQGGDIVVGLWEVRALLCVAPLMLVANGLVRERKHLQQLGIVVLATLVLLAVDLLYRYFFFIRQLAAEENLESMFNHENGILIAVLLAIAGAAILWEKSWPRRLMFIGIAVLAIGVELVMRRRAGLVAAEAGLVSLGIALCFKSPGKFALIGPVFLVLCVAYLSVFWNNPNSLGQPARAFRTVIGAEQELSERDRSSNDYREAEKINVWWNIQAAPITGIGLGKPYAKPLYLIDLSNLWPFWDNIPHNTVLHLWMKAGVVSFMAFLYVVGTGVALSMNVIRQSRDSWLTAVAAVIGAYIVMVVLFSYVDLGLTSPRVMIPFGIALGLIGSLTRLVQADATAARG